jgi:hypothetical protein
MASLARPYVDLAHESARVSEELNREHNREAAVSDGDAATWLCAQYWTSVWVAGAGPTLMEGLKGWSCSRDKLIAVGRALKPLIARGIRPDVVVTVDTADPVVEQFAGLKAHDVQGCVMVYNASSDPRVLKSWPGVRLATLLQCEAHCDLGSAWPFSRLFAGGSVVHTAIDAAVLAGAERVVLAGVDLSFPDAFSHVEGAVCRAPVENGNAARIRVLDGFGGEVATDVALAGFLRTIEEYIATHPKTQFIAASRRGARIAGTVFLEEQL